MGYLLKDSIIGPGILDAAVRRAARLETVVDPRVVEELMRRQENSATMNELTDAERRVLACIAEGHSNSGVAGRLIISERTVNAHVRSIMRKLDLSDSPDSHRRVLAVLRYLESGEA
jgi:DNA-binding NarL/FixJ family response regulator